MVNAVVFGATGMVGQGVLRECLLDSGVDSVLTVGRTATARVNGMTENALLDMPFHAYMFRPGYIQPMHGGDQGHQRRSHLSPSGSVSGGGRHRRPGRRPTPGRR